ncbi:MAG: hypothetical protein ACTSU2_07870 [Promethearchaeota archaeon]
MKEQQGTWLKSSKRKTKKNLFKNKRTKILLFIFVFFLSINFMVYAHNRLAIFQSVKADSYSFRTSMRSDVFIQYDGSITIKYWINFTNTAMTKEIDWVDIGMPNKYFDLNSGNASIDGHTIPHSYISKSDYIDNGFQIYLGAYAIQPGKSGQFYFEANNPKMIYSDYENNSLASLEFSPTWFDSYYCPNYDYLEVNIYFPPNYTNGNLVKYHYTKYDSYNVNVIIGNNHYLRYTWIKENVAMKQYTYGVSFPKDWLDVRVPWTPNPETIHKIVVQLFWISCIIIIVAIIYKAIKNKVRPKYYPPKKRESLAGLGDPSIILCFVILTFLIIFPFLSIVITIVVISIYISALIIVALAIRTLVRRMKKIAGKPEIYIETTGVNKDLSVVEAAIIRNTPLDKVIFLIMFGLIRKNALKIISVDPLKLELLPLDDAAKSSLKWYHLAFLDAVYKTGALKGKIKENILKKLMINLIKKTYRKMKTYDLKSTVKYYDQMIEKAWAEIKKLPKGIKWEDIEKQFDWILLDDLFKTRAPVYFQNRYYTSRPYWFRHYYYYDHYWYQNRYWHRFAHSKNRVPPPMHNINLESFADTIANSISDIATKITNNFIGFAQSIVDKVRPVVHTSSGSGKSHHYSGHGCACACACACAGCACACAGGGR